MNDWQSRDYIINNAIPIRKNVCILQYFVNICRKISALTANSRNINRVFSEIENIKVLDFDLDW